MPFEKRRVGPAVWFAEAGRDAREALAALPPREVLPEIHPTEDSVGRGMLDELWAVSEEKTRVAGPNSPIVIVLLGGRGAQAMHRQLGELAHTARGAALLRRLVVFTQDALAPLPMASSLSFVRDFERLLGATFFKSVRAFTPFFSEGDDPEAEVARTLDVLTAAGEIDLFYVGHGPEPGGASHLAYIKPGSGAGVLDLAGCVPISPSILEHHIAKFRAGGSVITPDDEARCRRATHILTLGPAALLGARRIVQSIVDADTAPAKRASYRKVIEARLPDDVSARAAALDENPGLWLRLAPSVRSLVLPDVLKPAPASASA